jgi:hypothetical protein
MRGWGGYLDYEERTATEGFCHMRTTIALGLFAAIAAGTAGVGALSNLPQMRGSDTLFTITKDVLAACENTSTLDYIGTGSTNGETACIADAQTICPMSRELRAGACGHPGDESLAEGIVLALDGLSLVTSESGEGPCNSGTDDCTQATNPDDGLAFGKTIGTTAGDYTFADWMDVLRVVFAGMDQNAGSDIANRDCNSPVRQAIAANWGNVFERADCNAGNCMLGHALRRDDFSGTTDVFLTLLNLPSISTSSSQRSTFCNVTQPITAGPPSPPFYPEFQGEDPIRRPCIGTGNPPPFPPGSPPPNAPTEQVCDADGMLGLVLPINPAPVRNPQAPTPYPTPNCVQFALRANSAPAINAFQNANCPNGDVPAFINQCFVPVTSGGDARCINPANNLPLLELDPAQATAIDGRVYNKHLRQQDGTYQTIQRPRVGATDGSVVEAQIVGAYYRIHTTRTARPAPSTDGVCLEPDATTQIGCLVGANQFDDPDGAGPIQCRMDIGYAGREAADVVAGTVSLKLDAIPPTIDCVRALLDPGLGTAYPLSRRLYLNSIIGFENVTLEEANLKECFKGNAANDANGITNATFRNIITNNGFINFAPGVTPFCEDFNEQAACGAPSNNNACANGF